MVHVIQLSFHGTVPVILDGVVGPSFENVGDVSPFVCLVSVE